MRPSIIAQPRSLPSSSSVRCDRGRLPVQPCSATARSPSWTHAAVTLLSTASLLLGGSLYGACTARAWCCCASEAHAEPPCLRAVGPDDAAMAASRISSEPSTSQPGFNLGGMSNAEVDKKRSEFNIKRAYDGRVALFNKERREWWDLKLDMKYPGMLLFRNPSEGGQVYLLAYQKLKQVDLSDDDMLAAISVGDWERDVQKMEGSDKLGEVTKLQISREGFYNLVSIMEP